MSPSETPLAPTLPRAIEPPDLPDFSTKAGAQKLAATIANYWRGRGATVTVETFVVSAEGARQYGIKSNLVNGLPRRGRPPGAAKRVLVPRVLQPV